MVAKNPLKRTPVLPPLRLETLKSYAQEIFAPIRRGESVATIWVPMTGRRIRNKFIINYPELFAQEIGSFAKYLLVYIEPLELTEESNSGYIRLIIKSIFETYNTRQEKDRQLDQTFVNGNNSYPELLEKLRELVDKIASDGSEIVLFVGEFDELEFADTVLYNNIKSVWVNSGGKLHFVFLLLEDITRQESVKKYGELNELLLRNIVWVPLLGQEDIDYLFGYFAKQLGRTFSKEEKELLVEICGGHPYLLKSCTRLLSLLNGKKLGIPEIREILTSHFEPRSVCQKIYEKRNAFEQEFLKELVKNTKISQIPDEAMALAKLGLVKCGKDGFWAPFSRFFQQVLEKGTKKLEITNLAEGSLSFDERSGAILIEDNNIEEKFTRQEYEILKFFLKEPDKLRTRDDIGEVLWGEESYDKFSDWAIDQVMSKIRKKLKVLGLGDVLVTVRGRGYKLAQVH